MTADLGEAAVNDPRGIQIQFRYAFVVDRDGLKVLDVTALDWPRLVRGGGAVQGRAQSLSRPTYAYVAAGHDGLGIVDIEKPEQPVLDQIFTDGGKINDTNDVKVGMTNASLFAYVADGHNGLQVVQLFSPYDNPNLRLQPAADAARSPRTRCTRRVDSFGRHRPRSRGGRMREPAGRRSARLAPVHQDLEMEKMFLRDGKLYTVTNDPPARTDVYSLDRFVAFVRGLAHERSGTSARLTTLFVPPKRLCRWQRL